MDNKEEIKKVLEETFSRFLSAKGFELVEIEVKPARQRNKLIRFLVDKSRGITVDECAKLNGMITEVIDKKDLVKSSYILEVASPGLDRPLTTKRDFERVKGEKVTLIIDKEPRGTEEAIGKLIKVEKDKIQLDVDGQIRIISLDKIHKAKLKIGLKRIK